MKRVLAGLGTVAVAAAVMASNVDDLPLGGDVLDGAQRAIERDHNDTERAGDDDSGEAADASGALRMLGGLDVRHGPGSTGGLDRDDFGLWRSEDGCTTRQQVLIEHGDGVRTDDDCQPVDGTWRGLYSGETFTDAGQLDIEHIVAIDDALRSGASGWSEDRRVEFGNDMENLAPVDLSLNRERGSATWDEWQPPRNRCVVAATQVQVKDKYDLSVTTSEKSELGETLRSCA